MKTKLLKSILSLLLIFSMFLTLFSCNNIKETDIPESDTSNVTKKSSYKDYDNKKDYDIIRVENGYRLVFHDPSIYESFNSSYIGFKFESMQDFYDDLVNGTFRDYEKSNIYNNFPKDKNGVIIFNPNELYVPLIANGCEINEYFIWSGNSYTYDFKTPFEHPYGEYISAKFICLTEDHYTKQLEYEKNIDNVPKEWGDASIKTVNEKEVFDFPNGNYQTRYTVSNENKTMYVVETCIYDSEGTSYSAIAFYISNGVYFEVMIDSISTPFDPEWLFEFDVEKYVPDQNT